MHVVGEEIYKWIYKTWKLKCLSGADSSTFALLKWVTFLIEVSMTAYQVLIAYGETIPPPKIESSCQFIFIVKL